MHRGGDGVVRRIRFAEPMTVSLITNRRSSQPYGVEGGCPGATGENWLIDQSGIRTKLESFEQIDVGVGEAIEIRTPGGGGFGVSPA